MLEKLRKETEEEATYLLSSTGLPRDMLVPLILFKILECLEGIDASLTSMANDSHEDHHNK